MDNEFIRASAEADIRKNYRKYWEKIFDNMLDENIDNKIFFQCASGYVFKINSVVFGMDIVFRCNWMKEMVKDRYVDDLNKLKYFFITHDHIDHYDKRLISELKDTDIIWIIPDFFDNDEIFSLGLKEEKIIWAKKDEKIELDFGTVTVFESRHIRVTGEGVEEYGYIFDTKENKRIVCPGDLRRYGKDLFIDFGKIDTLILHVWLGGGNAENYPFEPYASDFSKFAADLNPNKIIFGHLNEFVRTRDEMWSYAHAGVVTAGIKALKPDTQIIAPYVGDMADLF
ncbi:MAG: MBL fold metallo-hydrolase [Clostridia bacterium]|nr:MBL fold metallo-hydrolase [Clostridia bacterium]